MVHQEQYDYVGVINNLGYYDSSNWKVYLNSSGEFYLGSNTDSNYLEWNGTNLSIGSITIIDPTSGTIRTVKLRGWISLLNWKIILY